MVDHTRLWARGRAFFGCLKVTTWHPGSVGYFRGGGWSTHFVTRGGMPVTMSRLNLVKGLGPVLQLAEGVII